MPGLVSGRGSSRTRYGSPIDGIELVGDHPTVDVNVVATPTSNKKESSFHLKCHRDHSPDAAQSLCCLVVIVVKHINISTNLSNHILAPKPPGYSHSQPQLRVQSYSSRSPAPLGLCCRTLVARPLKPGLAC
jgi:hypothetical protein